jgi:hypothetical protein
VVALRDRARREAEAARLLAEVRRLEQEAERDERAWAPLLDLARRLVERFRTTRVFALNSDGSTPLFRVGEALR